MTLFRQIKMRSHSVTAVVNLIIQCKYVGKANDRYLGTLVKAKSMGGVPVCSNGQASSGGMLNELHLTLGGQSGEKSGGGMRIARERHGGVLLCWTHVVAFFCIFSQWMVVLETTARVSWRRKNPVEFVVVHYR